MSESQPSESFEDGDDEDNERQEDDLVPVALGRPPSYKPEFRDRAATLAINGATVEEIAEDLGVHRSTLYRWMGNNPDFRDALKLGRDACDDRVEASLYHRAVGYSYQKAVYMGGKLVTSIEHVPPDTKAAAFWLTNRRPKEWRETKTVEITNVNREIEQIDDIVSRFRKLKAGAVDGEVISSRAKQSPPAPSPVIRISPSQDNGAASDGAPLNHPRDDGRG